MEGVQVKGFADRCGVQGFGDDGVWISVEKRGGGAGVGLEGSAPGWMHLRDPVAGCRIWELGCIRS